MFCAHNTTATPLSSVPAHRSAAAGDLVYQSLAAARHPSEFSGSGCGPNGTLRSASWSRIVSRSISRRWGQKSPDAECSTQRLSLQQPEQRDISDEKRCDLPRQARDKERERPCSHHIAIDPASHLNLQVSSGRPSCSFICSRMASSSSADIEPGSNWETKTKRLLFHNFPAGQSSSW